MKKSFRLLAEYYSYMKLFTFLINHFETLFPSPYGVSFILILGIVDPDKQTRYSFRLLTELYSFLQ